MHGHRLRQLKDGAKHLTLDQGVHEELGDASDAPEGQTITLQFLQGQS